MKNAIKNDISMQIQDYSLIFLELLHKNFNSNYIFEKNCNSTYKIGWYLEKSMLLPLGLTADNVGLSAANAGIDKEKHRFSWWGSKRFFVFKCVMKYLEIK